jgi:hypothetical protein
LNSSPLKKNSSLPPICSAGRRLKLIVVSNTASSTLRRPKFTVVSIRRSLDHPIQNQKTTYMNFHTNHTSPKFTRDSETLHAAAESAYCIKQYMINTKLQWFKFIWFHIKDTSTVFGLICSKPRGSINKGLSPPVKI